MATMITTDCISCGERRAKEAQAFEAHQQRELDGIRQQFEALGESYDTPAKPIEKGSRFGWG
jgi:hypothetical protein